MYIYNKIYMLLYLYIYMYVVIYIIIIIYLKIKSYKQLKIHIVSMSVVNLIHVTCDLT